MVFKKYRKTSDISPYINCLDPRVYLGLSIYVGPSVLVPLCGLDECILLYFMM